MNNKIDNLEGRQFGHWMVLRKSRPNDYGNTYWIVQCSCGKEREITGRTLIYLKSTHCGCQRTKKLTKHVVESRDIPGRGFKNISGQVFGDLTVLHHTRQNVGREWYWYCQCVCGNTTEVRGSHLRSGSIVSCGCRQSYPNRTTHGLTYTREYTHIRNKKRRSLEKYLDTEWDVQKEVFLRRLYSECVVCGITEREHQEKYGSSLQVDHVHPLKDGHGLAVGNATILCLHCNGEKSDRRLEDLPERMRNRILLTADLFELLWNGRS